MPRQLLVSGIVAAVFLVGVLTIAGGREAVPTEAERERSIIEMETEWGLTPQPGKDRKERLARIDAAITAHYQKKIEGVDRRVEDAKQAMAGTNPTQAEGIFDGVDVSLGYGLKELTLKTCQRSGQVLRCLVETKPGQSFKGVGLQASAHRLDGDSYTNLPGAVVSAPAHVFGLSTELKVLVPPGTDWVQLSYRNF